MNVNSNRSEDFTRVSGFTSSAVLVELTEFLAGQRGPVKFDELRDAIPGFNVSTPDGHVHQACVDAGYTDVYLSDE